MGSRNSSCCLIRIVRAHTTGKMMSTVRTKYTRNQQNSFVWRGIEMRMSGCRTWPNQERSSALFCASSKHTTEACYQSTKAFGTQRVCIYTHEINRHRYAARYVFTMSYLCYLFGRGDLPSLLGSIGYWAVCSLPNPLFDPAADSLGTGRVGRGRHASLVGPSHRTGGSLCRLECASHAPAPLGGPAALAGQCDHCGDHLPPSLHECMDGSSDKYDGRLASGGRSLDSLPGHAVSAAGQARVCGCLSG